MKNFKLEFQTENGAKYIRTFNQTSFQAAVLGLIAEFGKIYHVEYSNW